MLHVLTTQVNNTHPMFSYFEDLCGAANNLKNATRFRQRQVITAVEKTRRLSLTTSAGSWTRSPEHCR